MPIVPKQTYEAWFAKTSPVYRSWRFLYVNPLWSRNVPRGASLCPFAWAALFSLVIFRPLVYVTLGLRWAAKTFGLVSFIRWTDSLVTRMLGEFPDCLGLATVMGLMIVSIVGCIGFLIWSGLVMAAAAGQLLPSAIFPLTALTFIFCLAYWSETKNDPNRCKVEWYLRALLVLALSGLAIFHTRAFLDVFVGWPVALIAGIWHGVCWLAGSAWWLVKSVAAGVIMGVPYMLGILVAGLILAAIGYYVSRLSEPSDAPKEVPLTKDQIRNNLWLIAGCLRARDSWHHGCETTLDIVRAYPAAILLAHSKLLLASDDVPASLLDELEAFMRDRDERSSQRAAERSATCKRFTNAIATLCRPAAVVWKQVRVACSYGWALVKARKASSCPYVSFHD